MRRDRIAGIERGFVLVVVEAVALIAGVVLSSIGAPSVGLALGVLGFAASMGAALSV